jgi:hypothetical protein
MIHIHRIRRLGGALAGLACAMLGLAMTAPAAFASLPGGDDGGSFTPAPTARTVTRVIVIGGMPGWQIALIAAGAAVLAAALAVLAYRALTAHRKTPLSAA